MRSLGECKASRGYPLSNLGITQWCADQMVVVGKIEGKRPKFPPLIGVGQVNTIAAADHEPRPNRPAPTGRFIQPLR